MGEDPARRGALGVSARSKDPRCGGPRHTARHHEDHHQDAESGTPTSGRRIVPVVETEWNTTPKADADLRRNGYQQSVAGRGWREPGDVGGHLTAASGGGPGEGIKPRRPDKGINGSGGAYGRMEADIRALAAEHPSSTIRGLPRARTTSAPATTETEHSWTAWSSTSEPRAPHPRAVPDDRSCPRAGGAAGLGGDGPHGRLRGAGDSQPARGPDARRSCRQGRRTGAA